jgi:lysozyme
MMNRQGTALFEAPLAHEVVHGWSEGEWEATPTSNMFFGLDIASVDDNKNPNWVQAKVKGPISFAFIRANYGDWEDSAFKRNWNKIKDAGIVRGAYLFLRFPHPPTKPWYSMHPPDPVSQARAFIKTVGYLNKSDFPPSLDVEFPGGQAVTGMNPKQLLDGVRAAWKVLKEYYGVAPIFYTSARVWREDLHNIKAPDLKESPLWLAKPYLYKSASPARRNAGTFAGGRNNPLIPPPWGDSTNWWIHQYQGDAIRLPGFTGTVDMNRFNTMLKGATGERVKWVQRRLGIVQNGRFDSTMENALRAFQDKRRIAPNGLIDPLTFAYLCWSNP